MLRAELPDDGVVFTDASEMAFRMHTDFPAYLPRSFFYPSNYIALGWAMPAAIGATVALPDRPVVSLSGGQVTAQGLLRLDDGRAFTTPSAATTALGSPHQSGWVLWCRARDGCA